MQSRYFLRSGHENPWQEVSEAVWLRAERAAGFRPKHGDGPATGGFSTDTTAGRIVTVKDDGEVFGASYFQENEYEFWKMYFT